MLGLNNEKSKISRRSNQKIETLIGSGASFTGNIEFVGGLYVEGIIKGQLLAQEGESAVLTIAADGSVEGEIRVPVVIISGQINGDVYADERVELTSTARVNGNIHYKVLQMEAGAEITGRLIHAERPQAEPAAG